MGDRIEAEVVRLIDKRGFPFWVMDYMVPLFQGHIDFDPAQITPATPPRRAGRLPTAQSEALRARLLVEIKKHPTAMDDPKLLAEIAGRLGINIKTASTWLHEAGDQYCAGREDSEQRGE